MIKRIVLEGVDNVGKSTVANIIKDRLSYKDFHFDNVEIVKFSGPPAGTSQLENFQEQLDYIETMTYYSGNNVVITDRDIYGEIVYGPMYRDEDPNWIWALEYGHNRLTSESLFILLEDKIRNTLKRDDGLSFSTNYFKRREEVVKFRQAFKTSRIPFKHVVKIMHKTPDQVAREIFQHFFKAIPMESK